MTPLIKSMDDLIQVCLEYNPDDIHRDSYRYETLFAALLVGESEEEVKKRLFWTVKVHKLGKVTDWRFDADKRRLVKKTYLADRVETIEWKLRPYPKSPVSYNNQQTNTGTTERFLIHIQESV